MAYTEVRHNRHYTKAEIDTIYNTAHQVTGRWPEDWTSGMFIYPKDIPQTTYYFDGNELWVAGEKNVINKVVINETEVTGDTVTITPSALGVYTISEVETLINSKVAGVYKFQQSFDTFERMREHVEANGAEQGWVYDVRETGMNYAVIVGEGQMPTVSNGMTTFTVPRDHIFDYNPEEGSWLMALDPSRSVTKGNVDTQSSSGVKSLYIYVMYSRKSTGGNDTSKYYLFAYDEVNGILYFVKPYPSGTVGYLGYTVIGYGMEPATFGTKTGKTYQFDPLGTEFNTSNLATKTEFEAFKKEAKQIHENIVDDVNELLEAMDEIHAAAVSELRQDLDAEKSKIGKHTQGSVPVLGNGWADEGDYLVTTDGNGNIVSTHKYGDSASRNVGLEQGNIAEIATTVPSNKANGTYPAIFKIVGDHGGIAPADNPLGSAAFKDATTDINDSNSDKLPVAGAVIQYVEGQMETVQEKLVNVMVQQDEQFDTKAELESYITTHAADIKPGFVYNVKETDMNYAVRKAYRHTLQLGTWSKDFLDIMLLPNQTFGGWVEELKTQQSIGEVRVGTLYGYNGAVDGNNVECPVYVMKGNTDETVIPFVTFNTSAYYIYTESTVIEGNANINPVPVSTNPVATFAIDPLGAEFDPSTLGTASTKNYGTAAGNLPEIGTALPKSANRIVLTDNNGKLKASDNPIGTAAYKGVADGITAGSTNLVTSNAVYQHTKEAILKTDDIVLIGRGNDIFAGLLEEAPMTSDRWNLTVDQTTDIDNGRISEEDMNKFFLTANEAEALRLFDGKKICLAVWDGHTCSVSYSDEPQSGGGWSIELTITTPASIIRLKLTYRDKTGTSGNIKEWVNLSGSETNGSGNAETANRLSLSRAINGLKFDGTKNVGSFLAATDLGTSAGEYQFKCISADLAVAHGTRITVKFPEPNIEDGYKVMLYLSENSSSAGVGYPIFMDDAPVGARLTKGVYDLVLDFGRHGEDEPNGVWHIVSGGGGGRLYWED